MVLESRYPWPSRVSLLLISLFIYLFGQETSSSQGPFVYPPLSSKSQVHDLPTRTIYLSNPRTQTGDLVGYHEASQTGKLLAEANATIT